MELSFTSSHIWSAILAGIPAAVNIFLASYIFFRVPQRQVTNIFTLVLLASAGWQVSSALMRLSGNIETALTLDNIFSPFGLITAPMIVHFAYLFSDTRKERLKRFVINVCYVLTLVLALMYHALNDHQSYAYSDFWGWINTRQKGVYSIVLGAVLMTQYFIAIYIFLASMMKARKGSDQYYQLLIITIPFIFVILQALITEAILPGAFKVDPVPVTSSTMVLFSLACFVALTRFNLFGGIRSIPREDLLNNISDIVFVIDADLRVSFVNRPGLKFLNYSIAEVQGHSIGEFIAMEKEPLNKGKKLHELLFEALNGQNIENLKCRLMPKIGSSLPVLIRSDTLFYHRKAEGILLVCRNITDLEKAQEEVRRHDYRFRKIIDRSKDAIALLDEDGKILYITPSIRNVLGYEPFDLEGRHFLEFMHPEYLDTAVNKFKENVKSDSKDTENVYKVMTQDREAAWIEAVGINELEDPELSALIVVFRNITERYNIQQEREKSLALFEALIYNVDNAMLVEDEHRRVFAVNQKFCEYFSIPLQAVSLVGTSCVEAAEQAKILMKEPDKFVSRIEEIINEGKPVVDEVVAFASGRVCERDYFPIGSDGSFMGHLWIYSDVTKRKQIEGEIIRQNEELKKINAELDKFVYSASHDIRSPLMSILGLVDLANSEIAAPEAREYFEMIKNRILKLDEFTLDIIHYSRNARTEVVNEPINVRELVDEVIQSLKYQAIAKDIHYDIQVPPQLVVSSDRGRLFVILSNLMSNAIKYQDKELPLIRIAAAEEQGRIYISVEDNGEGMNAERLARIFDMFTRFSKQSAGSGLGLYITKEIIEKLGGEITVRSAEGKGSVFTVILPDKP